LPNDSNWCPEVYRSVFVDRHNDDQIRVAPCCQAETKLESVIDFNFHTSPYLSGLRKRFNQGERPKECSRCWNIEKLGQKSRRQSAIEFFDLPEKSQEVILETIDHSATWACNLACIMCNGLNSSSWANEIGYDRKQLHKIGRSFQRHNNFLDHFDTVRVKKVHFNGGEPLLNDGQTDLLDRLDRQNVLKDVFISYNTNGTIMPNDRIMDLWSRARLIKLFFSIDATEWAFEYVRYPAQWKTVENNILNMKQQLPSNVMFGFNITVGTYNILDLSEVYGWFHANISTNREGDPSDFCWQIANNYDPAWLPFEIKKQAIVDLATIDEYRGIVTYLNNHINSITNDRWIQSLDQIDSRRGTNWKKSMRVGKYYQDVKC